MLIRGVEVCQEVFQTMSYIIDRYSGKDLVILGAGSTLWQDYSKIFDKHKGDYMGINRVIIDFPGHLEHAVSAHSTSLVLLALLRRYYYPLQTHMNTHSCQIEEPWAYENHLIPQFLWDFPDYYHGSSGMVGVLAGLVMGYDNIVLAGMPMDETGYYCNPFWTFKYIEHFMGDWEKAAKSTFNGRVTSLSGNTRELLGEPKWLLK